MHIGTPSLQRADPDVYEDLNWLYNCGAGLRALRIVAAALCLLSMPASGAAENATSTDLEMAGTGTCACNYTLSTLYYAFHTNSLDRVYTTSYDELIGLVRAGWARKADAGLVLLAQTPGSIPLYRLWNSGLADHLYTISSIERDNIMAASGWVYEGIAAYVLPGPACGTLPLYRLHHVQYTTHSYTTSPAALSDSLIIYGFKFESVAGYIWPSSG